MGLLSLAPYALSFLPFYCLFLPTLCCHVCVVLSSSLYSESRSGECAFGVYGEAFV